MSGAISFFLGLFGLGAAGAINAGQNISQSKKQAELDQIYTARAADRSDAGAQGVVEHSRLPSELPWKMAQRLFRPYGALLSD